MPAEFLRKMVVIQGEAMALYHNRTRIGVFEFCTDDPAQEVVDVLNHGHEAMIEEAQ